MSILACQEGVLLITKAAEALLRRQCEPPAKTHTDQIALDVDVEEAVEAANHHVAEHMMHCPICRSD